MTTATKNPTADFTKAFEAGRQNVTDLRDAYQEHASAEREVREAAHALAEEARVAYVRGEEHVPSDRVDLATERLKAAKERIDELKVAEMSHELALVAAAKQIVEDGQEAELAGVVQRLADSGKERYTLAIDELEAAHRNLSHTVVLLTWLGKGQGRGPLKLFQPQGLKVDMSTLHGLTDVVDSLLEAALNPPPPPPKVAVSESEMLTWHLAAGGSSSDSTGEVLEHYMAAGPRRNEVALEESLKTRDQRTWQQVAR